MDVLLFKTDIQNKMNLAGIEFLFNHLPNISRWTVDTEDIDKVLKIESYGGLSEDDIIEFLQSCGFYGEVLED